METDQAPGASTLDVDRDGPVAVVRLARPDKLNALSRACVAELTELVESLAADPAVRVLVLAGRGRMFSAGADVDEFRDAFGTGAIDAAATEAEARDGSRLTDALASPDLVTIAVIHGAAIGGAAAVVAACDLRVMADDARVLVPELAMGFPLAWGGTTRLVQLLGAAVTRDLMLTCRPLGAAEARERGFACRVVPADEVMAVARHLADEIARRPRFGTTAALARIADLAEGRPTDDDAATLARAAADPEAVQATRDYLDSI